MKRALPWLRDRPATHDGKVSIRVGKVVLREKRLEDAPEDYAWRTDEELARLDATSPITMSYEAFLKYSKEELTYGSSSSQRLAIETFDGRHIGNCMSYDVDLKRGQAELGIMIGDRDYWDKGYGTDSVDALLFHIFTASPLNRVYLHTLDWNVRARHCFEKAGFREVKDVRRGGMDFILMETFREEWERRDSRNGSGDYAPAHQDE